MKKNPLNKGIIAENAVGIGTVTPEMVEARARELAVIAGRVPPEPSEVDYEQAQRELTGGPELDAEEMALESIAESERWDPVLRLHRASDARLVRRRRGQRRSKRKCAVGGRRNQRSGTRSNAPGGASRAGRGSGRSVSVPDTLEATARALLAPGKGLLAADEEFPDDREAIQGTRHSVHGGEPPELS